MDLPVRGEGVPIPIASTYAGAHGHAQASLHDPPLHSPNDHFPLTATSTSVEDGDAHCPSCDSKKGVAAVVYRECLKNHAASIGGCALDGCGEFMSAGSEGTLEALKCSACGCHRNFHRKEVEGDLHGGFRRQLVLGTKTPAGQKGVLISTAYAYGCYPSANSSVVHMPSPHRMVMPLGALRSSEWPEEMECGGDGNSPRPAAAKKRFRTKFTQEQKEKMRAFAEKTGWRLLREDEDAVQHFCQEIGVKRRVLKVWMHNNKTIAKKSPPILE